MSHPRLLLNQGALAEASPTVEVVDLTQGLASPMQGLASPVVVDEHLDLARLDDVHLVARLPLVRVRLPLVADQAVSRKQVVGAVSRYSVSGE